MANSTQKPGTTQSLLTSRNASRRRDSTRKGNAISPASKVKAIATVAIKHSGGSKPAVSTAVRANKPAVATAMTTI